MSLLLGRVNYVIPNFLHAKCMDYINTLKANMDIQAWILVRMLLGWLLGCLVV